MLQWLKSLFSWLTPSFDNIIKDFNNLQNRLNAHAVLKQIEQDAHEIRSDVYAELASVAAAEVAKAKVMAANIKKMINSEL